MPNAESTLAAALNSLAALGTERDREQLLALLDRLDAARLRVLVWSARPNEARAR